jgi:hypothetical protein
MICVPSGDHTDPYSSAGSVVKRVGRPRAKSKTQMSRPVPGSSTITVTRVPSGEISMSA